jgi:hypothetical protein
MSEPKLHLIKLCVGAPSPKELEQWIAFRLKERKLNGEPEEQFHTTRQMPKERDKLLDGGSLYWVMSGKIQCRQRILDLRAFKDEEGIGRCNIVLEPILRLVDQRKKRPFQGWRYLKPQDAPRDLGAASDGEDIPLDMQRELAELGLI